MTNLYDDMNTICTTVGRKDCPYTDFKVINQYGEEVPPGTEGELVTKGPTIFTGYFKSPEDNAQIFTKDGYYKTGDAGHFDAEGFLTAAKRNFVSLQSAWDRSDITSLRAMMTDEMLTEIRSQLSEREAQRPGEPNHTEVLMIDAQLLGIEDLGNDYMASVEFSGMIREDASAGPSPFREVWNMTKPKSGSSGWLVAGVQALQ